jgi:hypothetical protein
MHIHQLYPEATAYTPQVFFTLLFHSPIARDNTDGDALEVRTLNELARVWDIPFTPAQLLNPGLLYGPEGLLLFGRHLGYYQTVQGLQPDPEELGGYVSGLVHAYENMIEWRLRSQQLANRLDSILCCGGHPAGRIYDEHQRMLANMVPTLLDNDRLLGAIICGPVTDVPFGREIPSPATLWEDLVDNL